LSLEVRRIEVSFDDNRLLPLLYGEHNTHLTQLEHQLGVNLVSHGNRVTIDGSKEAAQTAQLVLQVLWQQLGQGLLIASADVDAAVRMAADPINLELVEGARTEGSKDPLTPLVSGTHSIATRKRVIVPRTPMQSLYIEKLRNPTTPLVLAIGPAGTGKTYLAAAQAVLLLTCRVVDRIILSRPAVEAGERLGFLPGDMRGKIDPYLRPLYDALHDMLPVEQVARYLENGAIEVAPLAFMRGRTLANAFIILDEAQNTTSMQMRMFLTRLSENSRMVVTGDISQIDLPRGERSGLCDAIEILSGVEGIAIIYFSDQDVVRHPLVTRIVRAYDAFDRRKATEV
jgi:phosphate starvation-inducible PhoH-like protein